jgi:hypothetical protein
VNGQEAMPALAKPTSLEKINLDADLVAIGRPLRSTKSKQQNKLDSYVFDDVAAATESVQSEFEILASIKGMASKEIRVQHRIFRTSPNAVDDRVSLVHFNSGKLSLSLDDANIQFDATYLLFLKKLPNGDFEPVTGQTEASSSIFLVAPTVAQFGQSIGQMAPQAKKNAVEPDRR